MAELPSKYILSGSVTCYSAWSGTPSYTELGDGSVVVGLGYDMQNVKYVTFVKISNGGTSGNGFHNTYPYGVYLGFPEGDVPGESKRFQVFNYSSSANRFYPYQNSFNVQVSTTTVDGKLRYNGDVTATSGTYTCISFSVSLTASSYKIFVEAPYGCKLTVTSADSPPKFAQITANPGESAQSETLSGSSKFKISREVSQFFKFVDYTIDGKAVDSEDDEVYECSEECKVSAICDSLYEDAPMKLYGSATCRYSKFDGGLPTDSCTFNGEQVKLFKSKTFREISSNGVESTLTKNIVGVRPFDISSNTYPGRMQGLYLAFDTSDVPGVSPSFIPCRAYHYDEQTGEPDQFISFTRYYAPYAQVTEAYTYLDDCGIVHYKGKIVWCPNAIPDEDDPMWEFDVCFFDPITIVPLTVEAPAESDIAFWIGHNGRIVHSGTVYKNASMTYSVALYGGLGGATVVLECKSFSVDTFEGWTKKEKVDGEWTGAEIVDRWSNPATIIVDSECILSCVIGSSGIEESSCNLICDRYGNIIYSDKTELTRTVSVEIDANFYDKDTTHGMTCVVKNVNTGVEESIGEVKGDSYKKTASIALIYPIGTGSDTPIYADRKIYLKPRLASLAFQCQDSEHMYSVSIKINGQEVVSDSYVSGVFSRTFEV